MTRQFVTLYEHLQDFDDRAAALRLPIPRLAFAGTEDEIAYGEGWGDTVVRIAGPLAVSRADLEAAGWTVELLPGLDPRPRGHGVGVTNQGDPGPADAVQADLGRFLAGSP